MISADPGRQASDDPTSSRRTDSRPLLRRATGEPLTVVVVEDETLAAIDIVAIVESRGGLAEIAPTSAAALRSVEVVRPDVVLMGVRLPDGDGVVTAGKIRESCDAAIVFVVASDDAATLMRISQIGVLAVVRKPVNSTSLVDAIVAAVRDRADL